MTKDLATLTQMLLSAAKSAGADNADAIAVDDTSLSISVRNAELDQADRSEGRDIGLRVFVGQKQACVSSSDVRPEAIQTLAQRAVAMANVAPEDLFIGQAQAGEFTTDFDFGPLELFDPMDEPEAGALKNAALTAEAAALDVHGVSQVQSATAGYGRRDVQLSTSQGFDAGYSRSTNAVSCVAVAGDSTGMERDHDADVRIWREDMRSPKEIGQSAGQRVVDALNPRKPPTGDYPIMFDERVSSSLVGHILGASNGSAVVRGATWLRDDLGKVIMPKHLNLTENPFRPRVSGSLAFDSEGLPCHERNIVEDGVLQSWTLDLYTAAKLGLKSTASARRGTSSPPSPAAGNISLTLGEKTRDALLSDMGTGVLVTSLIGSSINENTGDYSRGASGFWVENGEIQYPISEFTIASNLRDMWRDIIPANDGKVHLSRPIPSLMVQRMTVAGA